MRPARPVPERPETASGSSRSTGYPAPADPRAGLRTRHIEVKANGCHRGLEQRGRVQRCRVEREVGDLRLGRDRLVDIAGVLEDRLSADEDGHVVLGCKGIERIQQRPTGRRIQRRDVSHCPCRQRWRAEAPRLRPVRDRAP